ncbi:phosphotransferase [Actinoplanes sp. CA-252034]|uniref:phosphotransferase n=1 Tax=Actinoplanes sp. CA-252034 TaxID=3239906 RepID=UPI003D96B583
MDLTHLGTPAGPMVRVHGGYANRMYRLDTDRGSFAGKQMSRAGYRAEDVFRFERAAFAASIPMPEPISAGSGLLVHRWAGGEKVPEAPVSPAYAFQVGEILARLHTLDVAWPPGPAEDPAPRDWRELAARATATRQPWAGELTSRAGTFAIADFVDTCERPGPVVLTHRDVQPAAAAGGPAQRPPSRIRVGRPAPVTWWHAAAEGRRHGRFGLAVAGFSGNPPRRCRPAPRSR